MTYLDRKYPEVPIFGRTPEETGLVWRHLSEGESYLRDGITQVKRTVCSPIWARLGTTERLARELA